MQLIENINASGLLERLAVYIKEKNAIFIVAGGVCVNRAYKQLLPDEFAMAMQALCACDTFLVNQSDQALSSPFMGANITPATRTAELLFLLDLVPQAEDGRASPFYSKLLGAAATHFFSGANRINRLWVPFGLTNTLGRGVGVKSAGQGCFIYRA